MAYEKPIIIIDKGLRKEEPKVKRDDKGPFYVRNQDNSVIYGIEPPKQPDGGRRRKN